MIEEELAKEAKSKLAKVSVETDPTKINKPDETRSKTPTE